MYAMEDRIKLFDHYDKHLGRVELNWNLIDLPKEKFRVFAYGSQSDESCSTVCTFGLSDLELAVSDTAAKARLEYLICTRRTFSTEAIASLLLAIGHYTIEEMNTPGLHGILEGDGPVLYGGNTAYEHFYLSVPKSFTAKFAACEATIPTIAFVQLIPITSNEKVFIDQNGWEKFEARLLSSDIDMAEFDRRNEIEMNGFS